MRPPATLVRVKGKWYAQITIPQEHRAGMNGQKQLRKSTGTSDKRLAERLLHETAQELYNKLPDPIAEREAELEGLSHPDWFPAAGDHEAAFEHWAERQELERRFAEKDRLEAELADLRSERDSFTMTIGEIAKQWFEGTPYPSHKTRREAETAVDDFIKENGDLRVGQISGQTGYAWAESLGENKSNKTLKKKIGYVSQALSWGERKGLVKANPFFGLKLSGYGKKSQSYRPFSKEELRAIFAQSMPEHVHCLLAILATTGMRLDEAALLDWEDVKRDEAVFYFDLTEWDKPIKNIGSARRVPVPEALKPILHRYARASRHESFGHGEGQMFPMFKRNADGKAQGPASKQLMSYIRAVTDDPTKVVHSLRGTFKDMLRDAGVAKETNDFITGHGAGDVAGTYGEGPSLAARLEALNRVEHGYLSSC